MKKGNNNDAIQEAKKRLYKEHSDVISSVKKFSLKKKNLSVPDSWRAKGTVTSSSFMSKEKKTSVFQKFFAFSIIIFIASLGFAFYTFFGGTNTVSGDNIDIAVLGSSFTRGGDTLPLQIEVTNRNRASLELADLVVEYPRGSEDSSTDIARVRKSLGTIAGGGVKADTVSVVLFGEQGSVKDLVIKVEYRVENSNAIFIKEKDFAVTISSAPVTLSVEGPSDATQNQEVNIEASIFLNSDINTEDMRLMVEFPPGFSFVSSTPSAYIGDNVWTLEDIVADEEFVINIKGRILGTEGDARSFRFYVGREDTARQTELAVIYNSSLHTINIKKPEIEALIVVNDSFDGEVVVSPDNSVQGQIRWVNNLSTRIDDVSVRLSFSGNAFNDEGVNASNSFYNSLNNSLIWDETTLDRFESIQPGESGTLDFSINQLPPEVLSFISNPEIMMSSVIEGRAPTGSITSLVSSTNQKTLKLKPTVTISSNAFYDTGAFQNTGPIPPKAGVPTTYTVVWRITNTTSQISNIEVRASLPVYSRFTGSISPSSETLIYDDINKEIVWKVNALSRGTGVINPAKEVSFQISLTPSSNQVGSIPYLISSAVLKATDVFTGSEINISTPQTSTRLLNDGGIVVE